MCVQQTEAAESMRDEILMQIQANGTEFDQSNLDLLERAEDFQHLIMIGVHFYWALVIISEQEAP